MKGSQSKAFSLIEVLVALGLLGLLFGLAVIPLRRNSALNSGNPAAVAALLTSELRAARNRAMGNRVPVGLVFPSAAGTSAHCQSFSVLEGQLPVADRDPSLPPQPPPLRRRALDFSREYPNVYLFLGGWNVDSSRLRNPTLTPAIGRRDGLTLQGWIQPDSRDFQLVFLPDGRVVSNDLPHFDGNFHILVCTNLRYTLGAPPPGNSTITPAPVYGQLNEVHQAYTISLSELGASSFSSELAAASAIPDCGAGAPQPPAPATPLPPAAPNVPPQIANVTVLPQPNPDTKGSFDAVVRPDGYLTLVARIVDPEGEQVRCEWAAQALDGTGAGTFTVPAGQQNLEYDTEEGCWLARWVWLPPPNAVHGNQFRLVATVTDSQGASVSLTGSATIEVEARDTGRFYFAEKGVICSLEGDGSGLRRLRPGTQPEVSPDGSLIAYVDDNTLKIMNTDGSQPRTLVEDVAVAHPGWSPNGLYLVYENRTEERVEFTRLEDGQVSTLQLAGATRPCWSRQNKLVYQTDTAPNLKVVDLSAVALFSGPATPPSHSAPVPTPLADKLLSSPSWSASGEVLMFQYGNDAIYSLDMSGGALEQRYAPGSGRILERPWLMPGGPATRLLTLEHDGAGNGQLKLGNLDLSAPGEISGQVTLRNGDMRDAPSWAP